MSESRIAIYCRISTADGRQDASNQLLELRAWAMRLGGTLVDEFIDEASGATMDRPALQQLLASAHLRRFDHVLIWALDRLGRGGIGQLADILSRLRMAGIRIQSHQESWLDTAGPLADLLQAIFAWVAQQELERIRERVKAGLKRARQQGKRLGRPTTFYRPQTILGLHNDGLSTRQIGKQIGISASTVSRTLQRLLQNPLST